MRTTMAKSVEKKMGRIRALRQKYQSSLRLFCRDIWDYPRHEHLMSMFWESTFDDPFFDDIFEHADRCREKWDDLVLVSRGHLKSTIFTCADSVREALQDPNVRIAIVSHSDNEAQKFLMAIRMRLEKSERILSLWGEDVGGPVWLSPKRGAHRWTNQAITLKRSIESVESTFEAFGIENLPTGRHYTHIVFDDIVTMENVRTRERRQKLKGQYQHALSMLESKAMGAKERNIGTRYHVDDHYSFIMDVKIPPERVIQKHCWADDGKTIAACRSMHNRDSLMDLRRTQGSFIFLCQYEMNPYDESVTVFKTHNIRYFSSSHKPKMIQTLVVVDPSLNKKPSSDPIGVAIIGTDGFYRYVIDAFEIRMRPTQILESLWEHYKLHDCDGILFENQGFQDLLSDYWNEEAIRSNFDVNIIPFRRSLTMASKNTRILSLLPFYESGRMFHSDHLQDSQFEEDLVRFNPEIKENNDHMLDCVEMGASFLSVWIGDQGAGKEPKEVDASTKKPPDAIVIENSRMQILKKFDQEQTNCDPCMKIYGSNSDFGGML